MLSHVQVSHSQKQKILRLNYKNIYKNAKVCQEKRVAPGKWTEKVQ